MTWNIFNAKSTCTFHLGTVDKQLLPCLKWILSIKQNPLHPPVLNKHYQDKWNTNQNQMKKTNPFYIVFQVLKVLFCKIIHQIFYLLLFYISFHISRHHFSFHSFSTSFNIIWKKDFCHKFSFFNGFTQPHLLNSQNPLSMTKVFCQCSLNCGW